MLADKTSNEWGIVMTCCTFAISVFQICQHLRNYSEPSFQRYIIRIVFLVPAYSVASCFALHYRNHSIYFETPRDCYEAWVIYNFMCLCMAYIGGPGAVVVKCDGKVIEPSWILCTCCCKPMPVDGFFLRRCKQGTLQFVILKPILALVTLILFSMDLYQVSNYAFDDGYVYITIIYNVAYAVALFWLLLLYVGTEELLKPYKPLLKFACFKTVIFMTFWQSFVIGFLATRFNMTPDDAEALQNYVIIIEMLLASIAMLFAFTWSEYQIGGVAKGWSWQAFTHAVSINDVIADIMHQINPSYVSYVLYHDGGPEKNVKMKKFRGGERGASKEKDNFSGLNSQSAMLPTFQPTRKGAGMNFTSDELAGNEDGAAWYGGQEIGSNNPLNRVLPKSVVTGLNVGISTATHVVNKATGLAERTGEQLVQWIPGITEQERNQAELLDSDSDAAYDEDNVRDNQIDDDMVLDDSDKEEGHARGDNSGEMPEEKPDTLTILQETFGNTAGPRPLVTNRVDDAAFDNVFGTGLSPDNQERAAEDAASATPSAPNISVPAEDTGLSGCNPGMTIPPLESAPLAKWRIGAPPPQIENSTYAGGGSIGTI